MEFNIFKEGEASAQTCSSQQRGSAAGCGFWEEPHKSPTRNAILDLIKLKWLYFYVLSVAEVQVSSFIGWRKPTLNAKKLTVYGNLFKMKK